MQMTLTTDRYEIKVSRCPFDHGVIEVECFNRAEDYTSHMVVEICDDREFQKAYASMEFGDVPVGMEYLVGEVHFNLIDGDLREFVEIEELVRYLLEEG